ncbi:hypothetical protein GCM10010211_67770 [Streptomyces albospinus]|uniref:Uncharacterized protein n=1 Tax=Streptomyces albospinus TaxID=285515 RepID=A0ABQ2VLK0_9ACTN|nr:hypothetical protein GCM10010211_67770 [Streptomyces albospinus]
MRVGDHQREPAAALQDAATGTAQHADAAAVQEVQSGQVEHQVGARPGGQCVEARDGAGGADVVERTTQPYDAGGPGHAGAAPLWGVRRLPPHGPHLPARSRPDGR